MPGGYGDELMRHICLGYPSLIVGDSLSTVQAASCGIACPVFKEPPPKKPRITPRL